MSPSLTKGIVYVLLWYMSVWCGFFFFCCPLVLITIVDPKRFRHLMSIAFSMWEMYPVVSVCIYLFRESDIICI